MTETETILLNGHPFHLCRWGARDKPVLLMLHGFPEYGGAWRDLAPSLTDHFHCVAPDQRGYGQSWSPEGVQNYSGTALAQDMIDLIEHLDAGPVFLLGHDWGAAVAYRLAMLRPDLLTGLVIANGVHPAPFLRALAAGGAQSEASQYIHLLRRDGAEDDLSADHFSGLIDLFLARYRSGWLTDARLQDYFQAWSQDGGRLGTMLNWYRASPLPIANPGQPLTDLPDLPVDELAIRVPHLLIWGDADRALLPEATVGLEDYAPDLTRVTIPGASHWLCHTHQGQVAQAILDWIEARSDLSAALG